MLATDSDAHVCGNVQLQMGQAKVSVVSLLRRFAKRVICIKRTSVRQSKWGFGLFIEEPARERELIGGMWLMKNESMTLI